VFDFDEQDIAELLGKSQSHVSRMLTGRYRRDADGQKILDEEGRPIRKGGVVSKLVRELNGNGRKTA
jgi:predicted transcriptional regulator